MIMEGKSRIRCRICGNEDNNRTHLVREMMFGLREEFEYLECGNCGCLQIIRVPEDLGRYYGATYYAYKDPRRILLKRILKPLRSRYALTGKGFLGKILTRRFGIPPIVKWVKEWKTYAEVTADFSILDVGCGKAQSYPDLVDIGFKHVLGIDPYIDKDLRFSEGVRAIRADIRDIDGSFDFVMMNHVLEHVQDPLDMLRQLRRVLAPDRFALVRVPLASSYAWRTYGVNWVQIDAPRHFHLLTPKSMQILTREADLTIKHVVFDSDGYQFWGSEQYKRDIPLQDPRSYFVSKRNSIFSKKDLAEFSARAEDLNLNGGGDSAAFYLKRIGDN
jgi:SAM-dependent methyltransferase